MTTSDTVWPTPISPSLAIEGSTQRFPVNRLFFVGRNYHAHANEMKNPVNKSVDVPFYFTKDRSALVESGATVPYPPATANYHYEMELVVAIGQPAFRIAQADAGRAVYGYACGLDMTRRDLQLAARAKSRPWDLGKDIENGAVCSPIKPLAGVLLDTGHLALRVNGELKQDSNIALLIWSIPELVADLSRYYHLQPGDLIYTGTPAGVGPVNAGDHLSGQVDGVGTVELTIGAAE